MGFENEASASSHAIAVPREDTPLVGKSPPLSSNNKTFANVFIAVVGSGVLGLPYTFKKTGWATGTLMIFSVAYLTYYCMMLLVSIRRKLESSQGFVKISSFGDLGFAVSGPVGRLAVDVMIVLSQAGFCVAYLLFIANTLAFVLNSPTKEDPTPRIWGVSPKAFYIWSCFPFQLGLNSIPTLTHLAPLSIFADVVDIGAMGVVMVEDVVIFLQQRPVLQAFGGLSVFFYGIGVAVYAFEGIGMVLPLEAEAKYKDEFGKILAWPMVFISLMYVLTNFGKGVVSYLLQLGLCINLFFTFPLVMNPVYEVTERRFSGGNYCLWMKWVVVMMVSVCCSLAFVLPSSFHWLVFREEMSWKATCVDAVIAVLGVVIAVSGTLSSLVEIFGSEGLIQLGQFHLPNLENQLDLTAGRYLH